MSYSPYDMSREAVESRRALRHHEVHRVHPEFPHRHASACWECALDRDEKDAEPGALRARLESLLADLVDADVQTILDRPMSGDDGTTHHHRLTTTDLESILVHLPGKDS